VASQRTAGAERTAAGPRTPIRDGGGAAAFSTRSRPGRRAR